MEFPQDKNAGVAGFAGSQIEKNTKIMDTENKMQSDDDDGDHGKGNRECECVKGRRVGEAELQRWPLTQNNLIKVGNNQIKENTRMAHTNETEESLSAYEIEERTQQIYADNPWMKGMELEETCFDCGVNLLENHLPGCDIVQCKQCGAQLFMFGCECQDEGIKSDPEVWTGVMSPTLRQIAVEQGLFFRDVG